MRDTAYMVSPSEVQTAPPFSTLFNPVPGLVEKIAKSMKRTGFDVAFPLVLWQGVVIDGNTRLAAAVKAGIPAVCCVEHRFKDESAALEYAIACQRNRRNLTDAEIVRCVAELDKRKAKTDTLKRGDETPEAQGCATGKSAATTAAAVGVSQRKVEQVRTVLDRATPEVKAAVASGEKSINAAYQETVAPPEEKPPETEAEVLARYTMQLKNVIGAKPRHLWPVAIQAMRDTIKWVEEQL